jgi:hypothetical protein
MVAPGVSGTLRPSIRVVGEVRRDTRVSLPGASNVTVLYRWIVNLYRSCVGPGWLAQETP